MTVAVPCAHHHVWQCPSPRMAVLLMCSCMFQATRDGVEIGAARLDRLDAATNQDTTEAALHAEVR